MRAKWTPKELKEIWAKGIKCFPEAGEGQRYGATEDFLPLFINSWEAREKFSKEESFEDIKSEFIHGKTHGHRFSADLMFAGVGTGKTSHSVGLGMGYAFLYPGSKGMVGGRVYGDLKENVIDQYKQLLTIKSPWDHPSVRSHPSTTSSHNKKLIIEPYPGALWSEIEFFQMDDWERVRGRNRDWMHLEEISQFQDDSVIDEAPRRLRSKILPVSHLFATTNPPESTSHWSYPKWNINQYLPTYDKGMTGINSPCKCQFCQSCLEKELGEYVWDEFGECSNSKCASLKINGKKTTRDFYKVKDAKGGLHETFCPGNEYYWRLLFSDASSNPHKRADFLQTIVGSSDSRVADLYARGKPIELNANNAYGRFSQLNINPYNFPIDLNKDLHWSFDFNTRPQCSVICQETYNAKGEILRIDQTDEIILFDIRDVIKGDERALGAGPEHVAAEFMSKFPDSKHQTIHFWGDPTAINKATSPLEKTKYQIIHDILVENGYLKVVMEIKKEKGVVRLIPLADRINNANWIFRDNKDKVLFFINPQCEYTIASLRDIKLDKSGDKLNKRNLDEYARRTTKIIYPEDVYKRVQLVSHPGDAITYYLYQKFPLIKDLARAFFIIPGEATFKMDGDKLVKVEVPQEAKDENKVILEPEEGQTFMDLFNALGFDDSKRDEDASFLSYFT